MMGEELILAVDAGTGDCRVIAFSLDGAVRYIAKHEWIYEKAEGNVFTFDARRCWAEIFGMLKETVYGCHHRQPTGWYGLPRLPGSRGLLRTEHGSAGSRGVGRVAAFQNRDSNADRASH